MVIGFDFDNTIVNYDEVFFNSAFKKNYVPKTIAKNKSAVKKYLFKRGELQKWRILQSEVYSNDILRAKPYKGFLKVIKKLVNNKINIKVVSHKTINPYYGKKVNLHKISRKWLNKNLTSFCRKKIKVYFEETEKKKILRIKKLGCNYFVDDLENILSKLPKNIVKILFLPNKKNNNKKNFLVINSWNELPKNLN